MKSFVVPHQPLAFYVNQQLTSRGTARERLRQRSCLVVASPSVSICVSHFPLLSSLLLAVPAFEPEWNYGTFRRSSAFPSHLVALCWQPFSRHCVRTVACKLAVLIEACFCVSTQTKIPCRAPEEVDHYSSWSLITLKHPGLLPGLLGSALRRSPTPRESRRQSTLESSCMVRSSPFHPLGSSPDYS